MKITTAVTLFLAFTFGLFAQQAKTEKKTAEQLLQDVEQTTQELLVSVRELDKMFPNDEPMAPMIERDHQRFLEDVRRIEKANAELDAQRKKSEESFAKIRESMKRADDMRAKECSQVRNDLTTGKVNPLLKDIWQMIAKNCDEQDQAKKLAKTTEK